MKVPIFSKYGLFILLLVVAIVAGIIWFSFNSSSSKEIRNVLLISIDTCRADHLSCYGYQRKTTPNIDAIAEQGVLFENAVTPVPITLPAHSSMLTGTIPRYHGVHDNNDYRLSEFHVTLQEILKERGFATGAVVSAFVLDSQFGLDQGFDTYNDRFEKETESVYDAKRRGQESSKIACNWLSEHKHRPFFLFLHYFDPHFTYDPPEPFKSAYLDNLYAGEIAYTDHCIGQVIDKLKSLGLYNSTLIVITSDHGESRGEHKELTHGYFIYQSVMKVPLIFKLPGGPKGVRIADTVGLIDIVPTVCRQLKISVPGRIQGRDLSRYLSEKNYSEEERYFYCESFMSTKYNCNPLLGVLTNRWKYIQATRQELYDLSGDPRELNNLASEHPQRVRILRDQLQQMLEEHVHPDKSDSKLLLDEESIARLRSLGYVGGSKIDGSFKFDPSKEDPKDLLEFYRLDVAVGVFLWLNKYSDAKETCEKMLEMRPGFPDTYRNLGTVAGEDGDYEKAFFYYSKYLELAPQTYEVYNSLGSDLCRIGRFDEAVEQYRQARQLKPDFSKAHYDLGVAYAHQGKLADAIECWNEALRIKADAKVHIALADALIYQGKVDEAIGHWEESLKLDPDNAKVHADLANALNRKGKVDQAILHLTESLRLEPAQPVLLNALAELLYTQGKVDEAIRYWRQALHLQPDSPGVLNNMAWIMATHPDEEFQDPVQAVRLAEKACELTKFENPEFLDTLSAAYAAAGKFNKAVQTAEKALKLYMDLELVQKADDVRDRLELFKKSRPYLEEP